LRPGSTSCTQPSTIAGPVSAATTGACTSPVRTLPASSPDEKPKAITTRVIAVSDVHQILAAIQIARQVAAAPARRPCSGSDGSEK